MKKIQLKNVNKILFIENKANYIDYILNKQNENEFVIYHGGMYSPIKGEFFRKIYENSGKIEFYHWSDIDIGGFNIFCRLKGIIPNLKPFLMDVEAFNGKSFFWKSMEHEYLNKLKKMKHEEKYNIFYGLIDEMIKNNSKLEQEAFL